VRDILTVITKKKRKVKKEKRNTKMNMKTMLCEKLGYVTAVVINHKNEKCYEFCFLECKTRSILERKVRTMG
jgi:glucose uptake protein GlcU